MAIRKKQQTIKQLDTAAERLQLARISILTASVQDDKTSAEVTAMLAECNHTAQSLTNAITSLTAAITDALRHEQDVYEASKLRDVPAHVDTTKPGGKKQ